MTDFQASNVGINMTLAARAHNGTSWNPEKRAEQEIAGFVAEVQQVYDECAKYAKSEIQKIFLNEQMSIFQFNYAHKYNELLAAKGRCFSVMITGGSGFNNRAHDKANNVERNKYEAVNDFKNRAVATIIRELKKIGTEEAGGELTVMQKKIIDAETLQEEMKQTNKRTKGIYPGFVLQNNNANIRRMKERLTELHAKEAKPTSDILFVGGKIIDNAEADRIQIIYDEIPDEVTRTKLKAEGWKWSPRNSAWQRMRTENSMASAKRITRGT